MSERHQTVAPILPFRAKRARAMCKPVHRTTTPVIARITKIFYLYVDTQSYKGFAKNVTQVCELAGEKLTRLDNITKNGISPE